MKKIIVIIVGLVCLAGCSLDGLNLKIDKANTDKVPTNTESMRLVD